MVVSSGSADSLRHKPRQPASFTKRRMRLSSHSEAVLRQTRERYPLPVAVTEVHNGCTAEEQLRWLDDVWRAASAIDAEAVAGWSWLGSFGAASRSRAGARPR